jgi:PD-(D/E)XK nuclease superfamily
MHKVTWSHSGLKDFESCARKYHEVKVLKNYPREETSATLYGTKLHEQAELYIRDGRPLDADFTFLKPTLDALVAQPGEKLCELEMALTTDLEVCAFKSEDVWVRGIADIVIIDHDNKTARVFDYKSGGDKYPDTSQLELMALMLFIHYPHIEKVSAGLLFVLRGTVARCTIKKSSAEALWWKYRQRVARIEKAFAVNVWNPSQSGLCKKYCAVTSCEFNGRN